MQKKILILTADAGFGHRHAAQAVEAALVELHGGDCTVDIVNPIDDPVVPSFLKLVESDYDRVVIENPGLYLFSYYASDTPPMAHAMQDVVAVALHKTLTRLFADYHPDAVISTYPAYTQGMIHVLRDQASPAINAVVITDLINVHDLWFHREAGLTFATTRHVYAQALEQGLTADRVYLSGLPVHPNIARETRTKSAIREALGWDPALPTVLLVGSARSRHTAITARLLDHSGLNLQLAVVSGGSTEVDEELRAARWQGKAVHTYGLVKNLAEMMHAADFILCKAGGMIVSEALACGLPLVLYEALPGQEAGNVRYVVESGAGTWAPEPIGALAAVYTWLVGEGGELETVQAAAKNAGRPRAAYEIAEQVYRHMQETV